jgi:hypothetical protein
VPGDFGRSRLQLDCRQLAAGRLRDRQSRILYNGIAMPDFLNAFLLFSVLFAGGCALRIMYMLFYWRSVHADVLGHDYSEGQRAQDATLWRARDSDNTRKTMVEARFQDELGRTITVGHMIDQQLGKAPASHISLWYKLGDPKCVTQFGPFTWLIGGTLPLFFILMVDYHGRT